jgi:hypothetical protein
MATATAKLSFGPEFLARAADIDRNILNQIAQLIVTQIVGKARGLKRGTSDQGLDTVLPDLSQSYIDQRKGLVHFRTINGRRVRLQGPDPDLDLDFRTNPGQRRSNLTLSGHLLDSLQFRVDDQADRIEIFFPNEQHPNGSITFEDLYEVLIEKNKNYEILNIDQTLRRRILENIRNEITRKLRIVSS